MGIIKYCDVLCHELFLLFWPIRQANFCLVCPTYCTTLVFLSAKIYIKSVSRHVALATFRVIPSLLVHVAAVYKSLHILQARSPQGTGFGFFGFKTWKSKEVPTDGGCLKVRIRVAF